MTRFANDFHSWLRHSWKSLANRLTCDQKIVIHGNSCIILDFLNLILIVFHWYVPTFVCLFKTKKNLLGANRPPLLGAKRLCVWAFYPAVLQDGILPQIIYCCGTEYYRDVPWKSLLQTVIEWTKSSANIHTGPGIGWNFLEIRHYGSRAKTPSVFPHVVIAILSSQ